MQTGGACILLRSSTPAPELHWTLLRFGECLIRFNGEGRVQRMRKQMLYVQGGQRACPTPPYVILRVCEWAWWNVMAVKWKVRLQSWLIHQTIGCGQMRAVSTLAPRVYSCHFGSLHGCVNQRRFVFELSRDWRQGAASCRTGRFIL